MRGLGLGADRTLVLLKDITSEGHDRKPLEAQVYPGVET